VDDPVDTPKIGTPLRGVTYTLRHRDGSTTIPLEASTAADVDSVFWFDGASIIAKTSVNGSPVPWTPSTDGIHLIRVIDDHGRTAERDVKVQFNN
jgi:penicillin-binding protein 1C